MCIAQRRRVTVKVDAVVNHMQLALGYAEAACDIVAHHVRIADHRLQPQIGEHARLGGKV